MRRVVAHQKCRIPGCSCWVPSDALGLPDCDVYRDRAGTFYRHICECGHVRWVRESVLAVDRANGQPVPPWAYYEYAKRIRLHEVFDATTEDEMRTYFGPVSDERPPVVVDARRHAP